MSQNFLSQNLASRPNALSGGIAIDYAECWHDRCSGGGGCVSAVCVGRWGGAHMLGRERWEEHPRHVSAAAKCRATFPERSGTPGERITRALGRNDCNTQHYSAHLTFRSINGPRSRRSQHRCRRASYRIYGTYRIKTEGGLGDRRKRRLWWAGCCIDHIDHLSRVVPEAPNSDTRSDRKWAPSRNR